MNLRITSLKKSNFLRLFTIAFSTIILDKTGIDPAIASTVVLTTITDIFGFFTFLGLGSIYLL